jgi:hypothetical protein
MNLEIRFGFGFGGGTGNDRQTAGCSAPRQEDPGHRLSQKNIDKMLSAGL